MAEDYARERPSYPDALVAAACDGLSSPVLEVGCGTGQLTAALVERGLKVLAIDASPNMLRIARERVAARFVLGRFEDVALPARPFAAVFSASAFHWIDPRISWRRAASVLRPGGRLALLQYCGIRSEETAADDEALAGLLRRVAPDVAFPEPLEPGELLAGVKARSENISAVWSFVSGHDVTAPEAADLFTDVRMQAMPIVRERTADQLLALFGTTALRARLGPERADALERETRRLIEARGGVVRNTELAVLVTARSR